MLKISQKVRLLTFFSLVVAVTGYAHVPTEVNGQSTPSLAPMLKRVTPAVVNILVEKAMPARPAADTHTPKGQPEGPNLDGQNPEGSGEDNNEQQPPQQPQPPQQQPQMPPKAMSVGSGVILDSAKGYIVTNAHVIKDHRLLVITLKDGRRYRARLVGKDDAFDLAVLQIPASHLDSMPLGDSEKVKVGDFVVAIGSPFGLTQTVTSGVVSAVHRYEPPMGGFQSYIQTDASINPGNSGGALVNMQGQLVGINTAIVSPTMGNSGIGFAIPSNMMKQAFDQLIRYGKISRGMLGVFAQNITPELARVFNLKKDHGAIITRVVPDSPADHAGLRPEDVIASINDTKIDSSDELHNTLGLLRPNTKLTIQIIRNQEIKTVSAVVGSPNTLLKQRQIPFLAGMSLQNFTGLEPNSTLLQGAMVMNLDDASDGALAGLATGDIITQANGQPVTSVHDLIREAEQSVRKRQLLLKVTRSNSEIFFVVQLG